MSSDIAIQVSNLSKSYHIYDKPQDRLKQMFFWGRRQYYKEFWALKDVSFTVQRGETIGIIGRNGSGKSTLLQLICGTRNPSGGSVDTQGRVAALLELGSGFNHEFTGRENVYMNASLLGLSPAEIDSRYDAILDFASIGSFVEQPIKTYSSGMIMRLAFAVQASVEPDVLIVDEALAVGDVRFQAKCFARLKQLKERGTTILLVTHSTEQIVTHCSRAILLDKGRLLEDGEPLRVTNRYTDLLFGKPAKDKTSSSTPPPEELCSTEPPPPSLAVNEDVFDTRPGYNPHEYRWGDQTAQILDFCFESEGVRYPSNVNSGARVDLWVLIRYNADTIRPIFGMTLKTKAGITVYGTNTEKLGVSEFKSLGRQGMVARVHLSFICRLSAGDYFLSVGVASHDGEQAVPHDRRYDSIHLRVGSNDTFIGMVDFGCELQVEEVVPS